MSKRQHVGNTVRRVIRDSESPSGYRLPGLVMGMLADVTKRFLRSANDLHGGIGLGVVLLLDMNAAWCTQRIAGRMRREFSWLPARPCAQEGKAIVGTGYCGSWSLPELPCVENLLSSRKVSMVRPVGQYTSYVL